jgi:hypothetical protein
MRSQIILIMGTLLVLFGFQNCSDVQFSQAEGSYSKIGEDDQPILDDDIVVVDDDGDVNEEVDEDELEELEDVIDEDDDIPDDIVEAASCGEHKIAFCHVPPGNGENPIDQCLPESAVRAHLREHGPDGVHVPDFLGRCSDRF